MYNGWVTITIPIPEKVSLNRIYAGTHWATRKAWKDAYLIATQIIRPKAYTGTFPVTIHYQFNLKGRTLDSLNTAFMAKCVEDSLVACGVFPDDTGKYVRMSSLETVKSNSDEVIVTIEPYAP